MLDFLMNDKIYENQANDQLAVILAQFDSNYIMDIMDDTINGILVSFDTMPRPNIVLGFEQNFKELLSIYPFEEDNVNQCRRETYDTIIKNICSKFNIHYVENEDVDKYSLARWMYDFYVANFSKYFINFYCRYLLNNKEDICSQFVTDQQAKDISSIYSNYAFGEDKDMVTIAANLPTILKTLSNMPIADGVIYRYAYPEGMESVVYLLESSLSSLTPIFEIYNRILFNEDMYGTVITQIRIAIQKSIKLDEVPQEIKIQ